MMTLAKAIFLTAEISGSPLSDSAAEMMAVELESFGREPVLKALARCRRELKTRLTLAAVIERIDDGRPGAEEAWAMMPFDEGQTVVWTNEMSEAFGICGPLLEQGDKIAARMAFKEAYSRKVSKARETGEEVQWTPSLGHDKQGRDAVIAEAVALGRIGISHARDLAPMIPAQSAQIMSMIPRLQ
jgi:hypothetical protein